MKTRATALKEGLEPLLSELAQAHCACGVSIRDVVNSFDVVNSTHNRGKTTASTSNKVKRLLMRPQRSKQLCGPHQRRKSRAK